MDVNITTRPEAVALGRSESGSGPSKNAVLAQLADLFSSVYDLDAADILEGFEQREALGSTGFGKGVAIPHYRSTAVKRPTLALLKLPTPCDFGAADAEPVSLVFGLISPENAGATHLHALAAISRFVRDDVVLQGLHDAPDADALFALLTNQFLRDAA